MEEKKKMRAAALLCAVTLTLFTAYVLLDAFVIERAYTAVDESVFAAAVTGTPARAESAASTAAPAAENVSNEAAPVATTAPESGISITMNTYRYGDSTVYVADITVSSAYSLQTALAKDTYGRNVTETTSQMALDHGALLAVNGDYYGSRRSGYVVRNGVLYRAQSTGSDQEDLCVMADGTMKIIREGDVSAQELVDAGALQVFSFGPGLIDGGDITVGVHDEVGQAMVSNPRTAIAMIAPYHYLFVVADGRTSASAGLSLYELAEFLKSLGATVAYNLDGGGSSTMVYENEIVNNPTTGGKRSSERAVSDIVYIK